MGRNILKKKGGWKGKSFSSNHEDPLFGSESRKRRKVDDADGEIESDKEDDYDFFGSGDADGEEEAHGAEMEEEEETTDEARKRIAEDYLRTVREISRREKEEREEDREESDDEEEKEGEKDSIIAQKLIQENQEESGRVRRAFASRVKQEGTRGEFSLLVKHRQSVTAVALSEDDMKGFSASKDGIIMNWDVNSGKSEKYRWPSDQVLRSHGMKQPQGRAKSHSKQVLALAVSSDGRYLATGGLDRHVHLWDTRTREHVQAFHGHSGPVSCLAFRQGSPELFSGSFDRRVKIWNVEDRTFMEELLGHQSEILTIDCLQKERALTAGRDRTMNLFKVHEESRLRFNASASSIESCCFVNNDEFLSGSDDGSIELWSVTRKKPLFVVRNAHAALLTKEVQSKPNDNGIIPNESGDHHWSSSSACSSWVGAVSVCRNSDLAASGAGNGSVRLWAIDDQTERWHVLKPLYGVPLVGFVNSLAFAKSAEFLVAGVGQEPRLGKWGRIPEAANGIFIHPLKLS